MVRINFKEYQDEIEISRAQNGVECDLYYIVSHLLRSSIQGQHISIRDITERRETDFSRRFKGKSGFADFVIRTRIKSNRALILGAIEVKNTTVDLDKKKNANQLIGHIESYKKVIYTNGLIWRFYNKNKPSENWEIELGVIRNKKVIWNSKETWQNLTMKLDNIEWKEQSEKLCS